MQTQSVIAQIPPLRAVRIARGKSLRSTASGAGIDPAHLSRIERGMSQPSLEVLLALARELELRELTALLTPYVGEAS